MYCTLTVLFACRQQAFSGENEEDHDGDQDGSEISNPFRPIAVSFRVVNVLFTS